MTRREFVEKTIGVTAGLSFAARLDAAGSDPSFHFPSHPRERIAIATWPFRDVIAGTWQPGPNESSKMDLKDFPAHIISRFKVNKMEPWNFHFRSVEPAYLETLRSTMAKAGGKIVNIVVDDVNSHYALDRSVRDKAVAVGMQWVDIASTLGCSSIRPNIFRAKDSPPNVERAADTLRHIVEYASAKNVMVNLENDDLVSGDAFFIVKIVERVNSPWLHVLPDFGNSLLRGDEQRAYRGIDELFGHAFNICHVKELENDEKGTIFHADLARTFGILKKHSYKGYLSMEWSSPGDPYRGTDELIEKTVRYLS